MGKAKRAHQRVNMQVDEHGLSSFAHPTVYTTAALLYPF